MLNDASINWWGVLAAAVAVNAFAGLWFTVVVGKASPSAVGSDHRGFARVREGICWSGARSSCMQVDHPSHAHTAEPPAAHVLKLGDDGSVLVSALHS